MWLFKETRTRTIRTNLKKKTILYFGLLKIYASQLIDIETWNDSLQNSELLARFSIFYFLKKEIINWSNNQICLLIWEVLTIYRSAFLAFVCFVPYIYHPGGLREGWIATQCGAASKAHVLLCWTPSACVKWPVWAYIYSQRGRCQTRVDYGWLVDWATLLSRWKSDQVPTPTLVGRSPTKGPNVMRP